MIDTIHNTSKSYQMTENLILTKLDSQETPKHNFNIRHWLENLRSWIDYGAFTNELINHEM